MLEWDKTEELCVSSMYWASHMGESLREMMGKHIYVSNALKIFAGVPNYVKLIKFDGGTFSEYYSMGSDLVQRLVDLSDSPHDEHRALFDVLEDVLFYVGEIVRTYERVGDMLHIIGYEGDVRALLDQLGADLVGFQIGEDE